MLPTDAKERKQIPIMSGFFDYFPSAIAEVAKVSFIGNEQHNPGQPLQDNREKSNDDLDCALRHLLEHESVDTDNTYHLAKTAWRILRALQKMLEEDGHPVAPAATWPGLLPENPFEGIDRSVADPVVTLDLTGIDALETIAAGTAVILDGEMLAPNDIRQRIAGTCETAQKIKDRYYGENSD